MKRANFITTCVLMVLIGTLVLAGCTSEEKPSPDPTGWQWPDRLHVAAAGSSGMVKYVSFLSAMEADTGMQIRVIPEASGVNRARDVKQGVMFMVTVGKSSLRNEIEALEDFAIRDAGPYQARMIWVHSLANSAVFVRGDSDIETIYDIKPGIKWAVWDTRESVMRVPKAILDWVQVSHDDVVWINAGTTEGSVRAVAEGRADISWFFPTSAQIYEAAAAPFGLRFLDLNSDLDPEGAARFRDRGAMYVFGPVLTGTPEARGVWGTLGYKYMVTLDESDPELVYNFAKWLDENYDRYKDNHTTNVYMTLDSVIESMKTNYIPCHDGLIRYLKEKGVWTADHDRRQAQNVALLTAYVEAWDGAIALADEKGIEVTSLNQVWVDLWEQYKKDHNIPVISMHQSLTVDAPWVEVLGLSD